MCNVSRVQSQTIVSPYSGNGLGELIYAGMPHHLGMGEVGIATPTYWQINSVNPALLVNNLLTTFQVGFQADFRNFRATNTNGSDETAGLRYLNITFPISRGRWTSNVALLPYSTVNYEFFNQSDIAGIEDTQSLNTFRGEGGITRFDWSNGVRISKSFSLGLRTSYIFGSIRNFAETSVAGDDALFVVLYNDEVSYSDFTFQFGAFYAYEISETRALNFGLTYNVGTVLEGTRDETFTREASGTQVQSQEINTDQNADFDLPTTLGVGLSYQVVNKLLLGLDIERDFGGTYGADPSFRERLKIGVGTEFTPDYSNVRNYWSRVNYRAGVNFEQVPYVINGREINNFGLSAGMSLPISGASSFDTAFKFGWRGTTEDNLIRENYFQIVLGVTINDRWFIKRRYE